MQTIFRFRWLTLLAAATLAAVLWGAESPGKSDVPYFHTSDRCEACHNGLSTRSGEDFSFGIAWRPTMMANSARDPYWHAGVRREVLDHPGARTAIEAECSICHMPMSRFESKLAGHEGAVFAHLGFLPDDRGDRLAADGVSCALCHQIGKDKLGTRESFVGGFTIAPPNAQGDRLSFGPYAPTEGHITIMKTSTGGFIPAESTHMADSEVCATCHTLLTKSLGPDGKVIAEFPEQVPYHEWLHSEFKQTRSCQSCHMQEIQEEVAITTLLGVPRSRVSRHNFLGGNFFMLGILNRNRTELKVESLPDELTAASQRTAAHLQSEAAKIAIGKPEMRSGRLETELTIENLGGHKLPTAYPSRRVWLHLVIRDGSNRVIFESGAVNAEGAIAGNDNDADSARFEPHYTEIRDAGQVQIYEAIMADSKGSVTTGLLHAVRYLKDNRILPRGFEKKTADAAIAVAGEAMADADFGGGSDRVRYSIDIGNAQGPFRVEAEVLYQPISHRWARNLRDYDAEETRRFTRYYDAAAASSSIVLVRTQIEVR